MGEHWLSTVYNNLVSDWMDALLTLGTGKYVLIRYFHDWLVTYGKRGGGGAVDHFLFSFIRMVRQLGNKIITVTYRLRI